MKKKYFPKNVSLMILGYLKKQEKTYKNKVVIRVSIQY